MAGSDKEVEFTGTKSDTASLFILICVAALLGVYLIAAAVLISKDGVFYIEQAQKLSSDPLTIIKGHPPGYPFLVFAAHKFVAFFSSGSSVYTWIYSAQGITLLSELLALIPLYFTGKILVGRGKSFWAILILVMLPYPAKMASDALRDWPYVFCLACGFWAILWGAKIRKQWIFAAAGLSAGLGYIIRPVCAQLIVYAMVWFGYCLFHPAKTVIRRKTVLALVLLIAGFLIPVVPYSIARGRILPAKIHSIKRSLCLDAVTNKTAEDSIYSYKAPVKYAAVVSNKIPEAAGKLVEKAGANLMWFFVLPLLFGIYCHFQKIATLEEKLLMPTFVGLNIALLFLRYCCVQPDLTHRYVLPLTVFTIFYVPTGLKLLSCRIVNRNQRDKPTINILSEKAQKFFYILLVTGLCICLPKLLRPIRIEKQGYLSAAKWLRENTARDDVVAVPDRRLYFYAERKGLIYEGEGIVPSAEYVLRIVRGRSEEPKFGKTMKQAHWFWADERKKSGKRIVIYKRM